MLSHTHTCTVTHTHTHNQLQASFVHSKLICSYYDILGYRPDTDHAKVGHIYMFFIGLDSLHIGLQMTPFLL